MALGDHEPPQVIAVVRRILVGEDEAGRLAVGVDRPHPVLRSEVRLCDRDPVRRDESALLARYFEAADRAHGVLRDLAELDLHGWRSIRLLAGLRRRPGLRAGAARIRRAVAREVDRLDEVALCGGSVEVAF